MLKHVLRTAVVSLLLCSPVLAQTSQSKPASAAGLQSIRNEVAANSCRATTQCTAKQCPTGGTPTLVTSPSCACTCVGAPANVTVSAPSTRKPANPPVRP